MWRWVTRGLVVAFIAALLSPSLIAQTPGGVIGQLELPDPAVTQGGVVLVRGWVFDPAQISRIELYIDDQFQYPVVMNLPRLDIAEAYPNYPGLHSSFSPGFQIGFLAGRTWPRAFEKSPIAATAEKSLPATEQSRERIAKAKRSWPRFAKLAAAGILLWALPFLGLGLARGWSSLHVLQYRFFTQAAFVTFGGAYAVLAYVTQAAVQSYHWITHAQAIDGLGLAETTPGPLIMVLQFVGFMSGWNRPEGMGRLASASLGALVTTYVTFLPCFFYIFLGAPYVESLRGNKSLTAALSGITAAVVGVILNLAVVFGLAVLFPGGWGNAPDWFALALTAAAFAALQLLELDAVWVVLGGGLVGFAWTLLK